MGCPASGSDHSFAFQWFENCFNNEKGEDSDPTATINICLQEISGRHMKLLLDYLYCETAQVPKKDASEFFAAADKLELNIQSIVGMFATFVSKNVVVILLLMSVDYDNAEQT